MAVRVPYSYTQRRRPAARPVLRTRTGWPGRRRVLPARAQRPRLPRLRRTLRPILQPGRSYRPRLWSRPWPYPVYLPYSVSDTPLPPQPPLTSPSSSGLEGLDLQAKESLRWCGLLKGVWPNRLTGASQYLIEFIRRFHRVSGFEWVVRDYFSGRYGRAGAILAIRVAHRLADRYPDFIRQISFERALGLAPGGHPVRTVNITWNGLRYQLKPWSQIDLHTIRQQFLRDVTLFDRPDEVRWVFDRQRLGRPKRAVVEEVRRILTPARLSKNRYLHHRRWLDALDRVIVVA